MEAMVISNPFMRRSQPHDPLGYVAQLRPEDKLPALLNEAFKLLELLFSSYDKDGAQTLMYKELEQALAMVGFSDHEKLEALFKRVDLDGNGTLDFCEFMCLLYLWNDKGSYAHFFLHPTNATVVSKAFTVMERAMLKYDADKSRSLDIGELNAFFQDHLPAAVQSGAYQQVASSTTSLTGGKPLKFPAFMHLLYDVMCKYPGSSVSGTYSQMQSKIINNPSASGSGERSALWIQLKKAFEVLTDDFKRFDTNGDNLVDRTEITAGIPVTRVGADKVSIISRLEFAFAQVDLDESNSLDFFEFVYLGFMMTQNGAYHDMVAASTGSFEVKRMFIEIHAYYRRFDADRNLRLTWDEIQQFCTHCFGGVPEAVPSIFASVKYQSSATQGRDAVDIIRFLKMLYLLVEPNGDFVPGRYWYTKQAHDPNWNVMVQPEANPLTHPARIDPVIPSKFRAIKLLGQGGQGTVHLGKYEEVTCAGKRFTGQPGAELIQETLNEAAFFLRLDHPYCHYLIGAKTTLENGGIMFLTEVCDGGSMFDFYGKEGKRFSGATAWRLGRECAMGLEAIHKMGYMHRDIKSLNIFLTKDLVAKVADFGMVTNEATASDGCGTPQWMAPEVIANVLGQQSVYDRSVDVYSFGVLLWELFHCQVPYGETRLDQMGICKQVVHNGIRPRMSPNTPRPIQEIILRCWDQNPRKRPTFEQAVSMLDQARSSCP